MESDDDNDDDGAEKGVQTITKSLVKVAREIENKLEHVTVHLQTPGGRVSHREHENLLAAVTMAHSMADYLLACAQVEAFVNNCLLSLSSAVDQAIEINWLYIYIDTGLKRFEDAISWTNFTARGIQDVQKTWPFLLHPRVLTSPLLKLIKTSDRYNAAKALSIQTDIRVWNPQALLPQLAEIEKYAAECEANPSKSFYNGRETLPQEIDLKHCRETLFDKEKYTLFQHEFAAAIQKRQDEFQQILALDPIFAKNNEICQVKAHVMRCYRMREDELGSFAENLEVSADQKSSVVARLRNHYIVSKRSAPLNGY
jgi:hypothetical protein